MAKTLRIKLDTSQYRTPTEEEIRDAKDYVLRMSEYSDLLGDRVLDILKDAAERIVLICYKYNIRPQDFKFSANENMQSEVFDVMDEVDEEIFELIEEYATRCTNDRNIIPLLIAWMLLLGRGGKGFRTTLADKLRQFLYDLEAQIAAMKLAGYSVEKATKRILETLTSVYSSPEMKRAIMRPINAAAYYIQQGGIHHGNVGQSSSGAKNVINMAKTTLNMVWQKALYHIYKMRGAIGYYQLRGSDYPCDICQSLVGFHKGLDGINEEPLVHPNCYCYRIPVYGKD